jgi:hypothetical protein
MEWQSQNTAQIVAVREIFVLGEIPHNMIPILILRAQQIKQKQVHRVKQKFMIQKQLGHETQILTVGRILVAIYLKHRDTSLRVPVNLIPRGVHQRTLLHVISELAFIRVETETEFTVKNAIDVMVAIGVRRIVPGICTVLSKLDFLDRFDFGGVFVISTSIFVKSVIFLVTRVVNSFGFLVCFYFLLVDEYS